jgi:hypothetical protein
LELLEKEDNQENGNQYLSKNENKDLMDLLRKFKEKKR